MVGLPIPTNRPARPATDPGPSRVLGYTSVLKHCLFSVTRHRQRTTRRARSRSGAGQTSSGRSNLGWAPPAGGGQATVVAPPARRAAPARRRLAPPGRRLGCFPRTRCLGASVLRLHVSPFVDPAQLLVLHQPAHALHKRFTCVRWLTPLLDGTLTLYTPHFRSLVRAPCVHLMTKKMTPQPKVVGGPPSGHFAR